MTKILHKLNPSYKAAVDRTCFNLMLGLSLQAHAFEPEREATAPGPSAAAADAQIPAPALTALGVAAQVTAAILPAEAASQEPAKPCAGKKRALKAAAPAAPKKRPSKRARARAGPKDTVAADPKPARSAKPQATRKAQVLPSLNPWKWQSCKRSFISAILVSLVHTRRSDRRLKDCVLLAARGPEQTKGNPVLSCGDGDSTSTRSKSGVITEGSRRYCCPGHSG